MPLKLKPGLTLYICRHGETEANVQGRVQGRLMDTPLTDKGREQARQIADIARFLGIDLEACLNVASPLGRAKATLEIIRAASGMPTGGYAIDERLTEIDYGNWTGLTHPEARALDPAMYDARHADRWNVPIPGGECYADVATRTEAWAASLSTDTFAVSHGVFTRIFRGLLENLTAQQISDLDEPQGVLFRIRENHVERIGIEECGGN
jgi:broad specificity phosphatase PhoE